MYERFEEVSGCHDRTKGKVRQAAKSDRRTQRPKGRADAGAANLTGAVPMIEALKKINLAYAPDKRTDSYAMAKINNRRRVSLFSTHPSVEARINKLQEMI